jgi:hypothetical protein
VPRQDAGTIRAGLAGAKQRVGIDEGLFPGDHGGAGPGLDSLDQVDAHHAELREVLVPEHS